MPYFSGNGSMDGHPPAPRGSRMLAGGSPAAMRFLLVVCDFRTALLCSMNELTTSAVNRASSVLATHSDTCVSLPGSMSVTSGDRPSPLNNRNARCSVLALTMHSTPSMTIPSTASANSVVSGAHILPALRSTTSMSWSTVAKLHLKATSPGCMSNPAPTASNGPLPAYTSLASYPRRAR